MEFHSTAGVVREGGCLVSRVVWALAYICLHEGLRARWTWQTSSELPPLLRVSPVISETLTLMLVWQWGTQSLSDTKELMGSWKDIKIQHCFSQLKHYIPAKAQAVRNVHVVIYTAMSAPLLVGLEWIQRKKQAFTWFEIFLKCDIFLSAWVFQLLLLLTLLD